MALDLEVQTHTLGASLVAPSQFRSIELFSGAGGLALATHRAGFRHELLLERDGDACNTLEFNISALAEPGIGTWKVRREDARQVSFAGYSDLDLIAGGAACQPFSIAGAHMGHQDRRNLLPEFIRAVREAAPRAFLLENVDGLLRTGFATYFEYLKLQLAHPNHLRKRGEKWKTHFARLQRVRRRAGDLAYRVIYAQLNAADYGVPQVRKRVFVVGFRSDVNCAFAFPAKSHSIDRMLHDQWVSGSYWERHEMLPPSGGPAKWKARLDLPITEPTGEPWITARDAINDLPIPIGDAPPRFPQHVLRIGARPYAGHSGSHLDWPSKTIKAGNHGVPGGENMLLERDGTVRYYTVREMARIQAFQDKWVFKGRWNAVTRQLGNAVPVTLGYVVAKAIAASLDSARITAA